MEPNLSRQHIDEALIEELVSWMAVAEQDDAEAVATATAGQDAVLAVAARLGVYEGLRARARARYASRLTDGGRR